jgi:hypothetical protein
VALQLLVWHE